MNFIDFCAGIGGGRVGLTNIGYHPIGFSEIDKSAITAYTLLHNTNEPNHGDLTTINTEYLEDFDLLIGGFPCQSFSIIGDRCGLEDTSRGEIIYYLSKILHEKKVPYFILENVKGLINHDKGRTLKIIVHLLEDSGYKVYYKVLNSLDFGVPHMRERIYFIGIREDLHQGFDFQFPQPLLMQTNIKDYLIDDNKELIFDEHLESFKTFEKYLNNKYNKGKFSYQKLLQEEYLILDTRQSDLRLYRDRVPTIRKGRQGILYVKNGKLRKLSGFEALLLQGFPQDIANIAKKQISNNQLLGLCGNAMTVNVIEAISRKLDNYIKRKRDSMDLIEKGSKTAKDGFKNESFVVDEFNNWYNSSLAKEWLMKMNYNIEEIESVKAQKIKGSFKADVQVEIKIEIKLKNLVDIQNLQVKLVSNPKGFNQIDKRWLKNYKEMWNIPNDVYELLQYFVGEKVPKVENPQDSRRMFINEFSSDEQQKILDFFENHKTLIITDILKGRGKFSAEWMLVILKLGDELKWALEPINYVLNYFGNGDVKITPRGSIAIGKITIQRKGGDAGRQTANMLQFKINPAELII